LISQVKNKEGVDLGKDKIALQRLKEAAEQAKKELSASTSTTISLQYLSMTENGPLHLDEKLTRAQLEDMTSELLDRTSAPFDQGRPAAPRREAHPGPVRGHDLVSARPHPGALPPVHQGCGHLRLRHRPRGARRRLHPYARRDRGRQVPHRRQGAQQVRQPGRG